MASWGRKGENYTEPRIRLSCVTFHSLLLPCVQDDDLVHYNHEASNTLLVLGSISFKTHCYPSRRNFGAQQDIFNPPGALTPASRASIPKRSIGFSRSLPNYSQVLALTHRSQYANHLEIRVWLTEN